MTVTAPLLSLIDGFRGKIIQKSAHGGVRTHDIRIASNETIILHSAIDYKNDALPLRHASRGVILRKECHFGCY